MASQDDIVENLKEQGLFKERDLSAHEFKGLVEHSHTILKCSACAAPLVDICIVRPNEKFTWNIKAQCPFCGDFSFVKEFEGGFIVGQEDGVKMVDIVTDGNNVVVMTTK